MATPPKGTPEYDAWYKKVTASSFKKGHIPHNAGKAMTEEERVKAQESGLWEKGRPAWNKGKEMWDEDAKQNISTRNKGRKHTEDELAKMRGRKLTAEQAASSANSRRGRTVSAEVRARISASETGKEVSAATRTKLSQAFTGKPNPKLKGYKHDEAFCQKATERNIKRWEEKSDEEKQAHLDKLHAPIVSSQLEKIISSELDTQGLEYEQQARIGWYKVDFYIPSTMTVIEGAGCYWHCCQECGFSRPGCEKQREADAKRYAYLSRKGYTVKVIWEHDRYKVRRGKWPKEQAQ